GSSSQAIGRASAPDNIAASASETAAPDSASRNVFRVCSGPRNERAIAPSSWLIVVQRCSEYGNTNTTEGWRGRGVILSVSATIPSFVAYVLQPARNTARPHLSC